MAATTKTRIRETSRPMLARLAELHASELHPAPSDSTLIEAALRFAEAHPKGYGATLAKVEPFAQTQSAPGEGRRHRKKVTDGA